MLELDPTPKERRLVFRCMNLREVLFGTEDDIWSSPFAYRMLVTLRLCLDAVQQLVIGGHRVDDSFIKSVVIQTNDLDGTPYCLDEVAEHLVLDDEARAYWQSMTTDDMFPHRCPECGAAAYIGLRLITCRAGCP